jgi:hypothetical protein
MEQKRRFLFHLNQEATVLALGPPRQIPSSKSFKTVDSRPMRGIMASLSVERSEPRKAMMAMAKVTWKDATTGGFRSASVTIENSSSYGACIRTQAAIATGARLRVDWRGGQFSGVAKYCRQYRKDFIVGIRRNARENVAGANPAPDSAMSLRPLSAIPAAVQPDFASGEAEPEENVDSLLNTEPQISGPVQVRTSMLTKWLHRTPQQQRKDIPAPSPASPKADDEWRASDDSTTQNFLQTTQESDPDPAAPSALLQLEDIYGARGIIGLRMGYGINKVVEMLSSEHARDLPDDMKRASVLMALAVAGISLDDVLRDAEVRLDALNTYEADQKRKFAAYESRKVQENSEIQAEMERVTARYLERLKLNMDEVNRMRSPFGAWQRMKQHEERKISDAVELCAKNGHAPYDEFQSPILPVTAAVPQEHAPLRSKLSRR